MKTWKQSWGKLNWEKTTDDKLKKQVQKLLVKHADINAISDNGIDTPLLLAIWYNHLETAIELLEQGANPNLCPAANFGIYSALLYAIEDNLPLNIIENLLAHGANPNDYNHDCGTALEASIRKNNIEEIKKLLDYGANPNVRYAELKKPLEKAICEKHFELVKELLDHGAKIKDPSSKFSFFKLALQNEAPPKIIKELLIHGADIDELQFKHIYHCLACFDEIEDTRLNKQGDTLLHLVSDPNLVSLLPAFGGIDVNIKNDKGMTPLHAAVIKNHIEVIERLINLDADVNAKDNDGNTPLHSAITAKNSEISKKLLDHGANIYIKNNKGETPAVIAIRKLGVKNSNQLIKYAKSVKKKSTSKNKLKNLLHAKQNGR